jgi:flagellar biosynthesis/type III secretory pathway protein FliH
MKRLLLGSAVGLGLLAFAGSARADSTDWLGNDRPAYSAAERQSYYDSNRTAYDNGYREGIKQGEKDGRKNNAARYQDERTFQRADKGYHREFGPIERYRQSFRSGYASGYSEAYQRYAPSYGYGGYRNGRAIPRRGPVYSDRNTFPGSTYPGQYPRQGRAYTTAAVQNGLNDGYEKGVEDARKNRSFDPLRHDWYRDGDRHYSSRYGSREEYKDLYRRGFNEGYERGYRDRR